MSLFLSPLPRRRFLYILAASLAAVQVRARPSLPPNNLGEALRKINLPFPRGRLDVVKQALRQDGTDHIMDAVIRLTWAPGYRQRRFVGQGKTESAAQQAVLAQVRTTLIAPLTPRV